MKANELRVGNWVTGDDGPQKVAYLGETIGLWNSIGGTEKYQHNPIISHDIDNLKPIPLTPEILGRAGFDKYVVTTEGSVWGPSVLTYYKKETPRFRYISIRLQELEDEVNYVWEGDFSGYIKSLHQLQNLVFALTGEELNIEL
jgi:hypothetical protein